MRPFCCEKCGSFRMKIHYYDEVLGTVRYKCGACGYETYYAAKKRKAKQKGEK